MHTWEALHAAAARAPVKPRAEGEYQVGELIINPGARAPQLQLDTLLEANDRFRATWQHRRKDIDASDDSSLHVYEMSLASFAVHAGWTDQAIVDLLVEWRRTWGPTPEKRAPKYPGYYPRTLKRAHALGRYAERTPEERSAFQERLDDADPEELTSDPEGLAELSEYFDYPVTAVIRTESEPYQWSLVMDKEVKIGGVSALTTFKKLQDAGVEASNGKSWLDKKHRKALPEIVKRLCAVAQPRYLGAEADPKHETREWVAQYLSTHKPVDYVPNGSHGLEELELRQPFCREGVVYFWSVQFREWLAGQRHEQVGRNDLLERLHQAGYEGVHLNLRLKDKPHHTVDVRRVPPSVVETEPEEGE